MEPLPLKPYIHSCASKKHSSTAVDVDAYPRRPNLHLPYTILRCVRCWIALWPQQCIYLPSLSAFKVVAKLYQNQATPRMPSVFHRWLKALPCAPRGHIFLPRMLGQQGGKLDTNSPEEGTVSTRRHASLFRSSLLTSGGGLLVLLAAAASSLESSGLRRQRLLAPFSGPWQRRSLPMEGAVVDRTWCVGGASRAGREGPSTKAVDCTRCVQPTAINSVGKYIIYLLDRSDMIDTNAPQAFVRKQFRPDALKTWMLMPMLASTLTLPIRDRQSQRHGGLSIHLREIMQEVQPRSQNANCNSGTPR